MSEIVCRNNEILNTYRKWYTELDMPSGDKEIIHEKWEKHIPTLE